MTDVQSKVQQRVQKNLYAPAFLSTLRGYLLLSVSIKVAMLFNLDFLFKS